jgi:hypothetical protein
MDRCSRLHIGIIITAVDDGRSGWIHVETTTE